METGLCIQWNCTKRVWGAERAGSTVRLSGWKFLAARVKTEPPNPGKRQRGCPFPRGSSPVPAGVRRVWFLEGSGSARGRYRAGCYQPRFVEP